MAFGDGLVNFFSGSSRNLKLLGLLYLFAIHIYKPVKKTYERRYGPPSVVGHDHNSPLSSSSSETRSPNDDDDNERRNSQQQQQQVVDWRWRGLPRLWPTLILFRTLSTMVMIYAVIKSLIPYITPWLNSLLKFDRPIHCYTLGRFVIQKEVNQMTSFLFASYHLGWRCVQRFLPNSIFCSTLYIVLLDRKDLIQYHELMHSTTTKSTVVTNLMAESHYRSHSGFAHQHLECAHWRSSSAKLYSNSTQASTPLDRRKQFMHDVMSFRIEHDLQTKYQLRPTRSLKACDHLRRVFVIYTLFNLTVLALLTLAIAVPVLFQISNVHHYLEEYQGCSPELDAMNASGQLTHWWEFQMVTTHQWLALGADAIENTVLWFESGIAASFDFALTLLINHDLHLYWLHIDKNIEGTLRLVMKNQFKQKRRSARSSMEFQPAPPGQRDAASSHHPRLLHISDVPEFNAQSCSSPYNEKLAAKIYQLQMQIQDFIKEAERANKFITDSYSVILTMWFTIFAYWTYKIFSQAIPYSITVLLALLLFVVTLTGVVILGIQRNCKKSYPKICSLMAHDQSQHKRNFIKILDYFVKNRICFTIFRGYVMKSTTLLTIIGYSFSCFFIVGSMYYR